MAYKPPKPTKAQLAEAKVRAAASGISMNQSAKGLRNASKAIVTGASLLPAGRAVKAVSVAAKPFAAAARNAAGKKVVNATMGKAAAEKYAATAAKKTAQRTQTASDLKNARKVSEPSKASVKVKPAAKQKPNPPDMAKIANKYESRSYRTLDDPALSRKDKIQIKKLVSNRPSTKPSAFGSVNGRIKINSNPVKPKPAPKKK